MTNTEIEVLQKVKYGLALLEKGVGGNAVYCLKIPDKSFTAISSSRPERKFEISPKRDSVNRQMSHRRCRLK